LTISSASCFEGRSDPVVFFDDFNKLRTKLWITVRKNSRDGGKDGVHIAPVFVAARAEKTCTEPFSALRNSIGDWESDCCFPSPRSPIQPVHLFFVLAIYPVLDFFPYTFTRSVQTLGAIDVFVMSTVNATELVQKV